VFQATVHRCSVAAAGQGWRLLESPVLICGRASRVEAARRSLTSLSRVVSGPWPPGAFGLVVVAWRLVGLPGGWA